MGKGNRSRNNGYQEAYAMGASASRKKAAQKADKTAFWMGIVIAILLVGAIALSVFAGSGIAGRNTVLISSDNYEVDANMITYYENQVYSNLFSQYFSYYYQYFYAGDYEQAYTAAQQALSGKTLKSYYSSAITTLKEVLILCEAAKAEGIALDADDMKAIDEALAQYEGQFSQIFGAGVNEADIRKAIELQELAVKYYDIYSEKEMAAATEDEMNEFRENNKGDFYVVDYLALELSVLASDYKDNADGFAVAKALVDEYAEKLENATTVEEFKTAVIEYVIKTEFDKLASTEIDAAAMPDEVALEVYKQQIIDGTVALLINGTAYDLEGGEEGSVEAAISTITTTLIAKCDAAVKTAEQAYTEEHNHEGEEADHEEPAAEALWLSSADRKIGETYKTEASDDAEYTKTVYMFAGELRLIDDMTKDVGHILISANKSSAKEEELSAAKAKAEGVLSKYLAGEKTEESFEALGWEYTEDSNVFYDNVVLGDMAAEFEDWLFDDARKVGDTDVVQTDYGFHVMLYRGEAKLADVNARIGIVNEKYSAMLEANQNKVTVNEKAADKYSA